jgi:hypothetical protein
MRRVRLVTDRILATFAAIVDANRDRAYRLWLISPWIGLDSGDDDPLLLLLDAARVRSCSIIVITRPPDHAWHARAIELLAASELAVIYTARHLHTKLYIAECDGFRAAILGSPNLTPCADRNNAEIAVEFRTTHENITDDVTAIVTELTEYASSLRGEPGVALL